MRDSPGKLPDRFEFLRLQQLPLHGPQPGYVLSDNFKFRLGVLSLQ